MQNDIQNIDVNKSKKPKIVIVGCGGAGNNTINRIHKIGISGVETVAIDTDKQHLDKIQADKHILIGRSLRYNPVSGCNSDVGKRAAETEEERIALIDPVEAHLHDILILGCVFLCHSPTKVTIHQKQFPLLTPFPQLG
jgi:hypothetical protein